MVTITPTTLNSLFSHIRRRMASQSAATTSRNQQRQRYYGDNQGSASVRKDVRVRPTHFLAIPLNTNALLGQRLSAFQSQILAARESEHGGYIRGLHPSICISPIRYHLTLGVMALKGDTKSPKPGKSEEEEKTISSALELLRSLKPQIDEILHGDENPSRNSTTDKTPPLKVRLDHLAVMTLVKAPKPRSSPGTQEAGAASTTSSQQKASHTDMWADLLYLNPSEEGPEGTKLRRLGDVINSTFKKAGYLTDLRPLNFHCSIINTSARKPFRNGKHPFCYTDILRCDKAIEALFAKSPDLAFGRPPSVPMGMVPHPLKGIEGHDEWMEVDVREIGLWSMGSYEKDGAYVSVGRLEL